MSPPHESPDEWYSRQGERKGNRELAVSALGELYRAFELPEPEEVVWLGSPRALRDHPPDAETCAFYEALLKFVGGYRPGTKVPADLAQARQLTPWEIRPRDILQYEFERSPPGRALISRVELIARALKGPWPARIKLFDLKIKPICRGLSSCDPIPWSLNLDRFWSLLYTLDILGDAPAWRGPLAALVSSCGFVAVDGAKVLLCEPPIEPLAVRQASSVLTHANLWPEGWAPAELAHDAEHPALSWPDGWTIWAWQGLPVPPPDQTTLDGPDERLRHLLLDRLGSRCPPRLRRQQLQNRYERLTREEVPSKARPWPSELAEPIPMVGQKSWKLADGAYYSVYPGGQLRLAARCREHLLSWLLLDQELPWGYFGEPTGGQYYYWNGYLEDFSPWDDDSEPYPCPVPFADWARTHLDEMFGRRR
ncbi:MAG: hypothetical protein AMXMBFR33_71260 [Candidatus Xenobia bacterium]